MRHVGNQAHHAQDPARDRHHARIGEQLRRQLRPDVFAGGDAADDHACRRRDHQGGNLRNQAIADGQQRIGLGRRADVEAVLRHADNQAADYVDRHDHQARDRIAAHELAGTVHRPVEVCLLGDARAARACLVFGNQAGIQVGIDRHLLAGHRVQGKPRGHFGDPARTLRDHHEVDHDQDDEDDDTDRVVAAHQEMAERLDHMTGRARTGMALQQHDAGRCHIQRQAQQGREQQHTRECGEFERFAGVHADQQHHHRHRDIEGEQQIEHERRQRQDHHAQDQDDQDRAGHARELHIAQHLRNSEAVRERGIRRTHARLPSLSSSGGTAISKGRTGIVPPSLFQRRN